MVASTVPDTDDILAPHTLVDNANFEELAANCAELKRWEFQLVIAPLELIGGTGSPVNPIAIF